MLNEEQTRYMEGLDEFVNDKKEAKLLIMKLERENGEDVDIIFNELGQAYINDNGNVNQIEDYISVFEILEQLIPDKKQEFVGFLLKDIEVMKAKDFESNDRFKEYIELYIRERSINRRDRYFDFAASITAIVSVIYDFLNSIDKRHLTKEQMVNYKDRLNSFLINSL